MDISGKNDSFIYAMSPPLKLWVIPTIGDKTSMASLTPFGVWKGTPTQWAFSLDTAQQIFSNGRWLW